jgi:hypothetical protein
VKELLGVDGRIILKWIFGKDGRAWIRCMWLSIGQVAASCEHVKKVETVLTV